MVCFDLKTPDTITLVSYTAPDSSFVASKASQQVIFDKATGTFGAGWHCLTITVPMCFFQIDFICGPAIDHFGPAGSNVFYRAEKRLFDAGQGGTDYCFNGGGTVSGYALQRQKQERHAEFGRCWNCRRSHHAHRYNLLRPQGQALPPDRRERVLLLQGTPAGTYSIAETQPKGFTDSVDPIGTVNGTKNGKELTNDSISSIVLGLTSVGINYDFAENK